MSGTEITIIILLVLVIIGVFGFGFLLLKRLKDMDDRFSNLDTALEELESTIEQQGTVISGAVQLINDFADRFESAADDADQVRALASKAREQSSALAAALVRGTPAEDTEDLPAGDGGDDAGSGDGSGGDDAGAGDGSGDGSGDGGEAAGEGDGAAEGDEAAGEGNRV